MTRHTQHDLLKADTERYFDSSAAIEMAKSPRVSVSMPLPSVRFDREVMVYHFHRFVEGATDDHAIAGWRYVMDGRQKRISEARGLRPAQ